MIELERRRVWLAGCTRNPSGNWVTQRARNLVLDVGDREQQLRLLECLDWLLVVGRRQLDRVLPEYVDHYNRERPHQALELRAPQPSPQVIPLRPRHQAAVRRRERLGGLIHEYAWAA